MGLSGNWRMQHTLNSNISQTECCFFVTEGMNGAYLSVFRLHRRLAQEILFLTVSHLSWPYYLYLTQDATVQRCCRPDRNIRLSLCYRESVWKGVELRQWFVLSFGDKEFYWTVQRLLTTRVYLFSWRCSVTFLLKTYVPSNVTLQSHYK